MKKFLVVTMLFAGSLIPRTASAREVPGVVPPASSVLRSIGVKGVAAARVVVYQRNGVKLAAIVNVKGVQKLLWSRPLPAEPARLSSPGPTGLIEAVVRPSGSEQAQIFAYKVNATRVASAIVDQPSGEVTAAEGANFHGLAFTLREPDSQHVGSVKYRYETTYSWGVGGYAVKSRITVPDYASTDYPSPNATVTTKAGNVVLIKLEVADTDLSRDTGLMNRTSLDPDSGMIFVWSAPVLDSFWMEDTYIPLSIAFLGPNGDVHEVQDMQPLTTTFHTPGATYQFAIEANLGYFRTAGIAPGDTLALHLTP